MFWDKIYAIDLSASELLIEQPVLCAVPNKSAGAEKRQSELHIPLGILLEYHC